MMKPRKVRLTGKMLEVPPEELKQVVGGSGDSWTTDPPGFALGQEEHAGDHPNENSPIGKGVLDPGA